MTTKPIWLLDFDGVINACSRNFPDTWPADTWQMKTVEGFPIRWSTKVVDFINDKSSDVDIVWHSTWGAEGLTEVLEHDLDIGHLRVSVAERTDGMLNGIGWWKLPVALEVIDLERPVIWTDDDLVLYPQISAATENDNILLISPDTKIGLTPEHLEEIDAFISAN